MFGWFKSKKEKQADRTIKLLDRAIREIHPDRFIDPLDAEQAFVKELSSFSMT